MQTRVFTALWLRSAERAEALCAGSRSGIPFIDISDCYWCADGASVPENSTQILVQYDDLSPEVLNTLELQLMGRSAI